MEGTGLGGARLLPPVHHPRGQRSRFACNVLADVTATSDMQLPVESAHYGKPINWNLTPINICS
jgi:hypothetical protein